MNGLDIAILCILGFTFIRGIMTGLMQSVSGFVGALAGFYAGFMYYPLFGEVLSQWFGPGALINIISFFIIFCSVLLIISLLGRLLKWIMKIAFLGWVDRLGGGLLGILKGGVIVTVIVIALTTFLPSNTKLLKDSQFIPYVSGVSEIMMKMVPKDLNKATFNNKMDQLKRIWEDREFKQNDKK